MAKRLAAIPAEILTHVRPALVQGAGDLADMARALVPEDQGDLKASIAVTPPGATTPAYAEGGGKRVAADNQALVTVGNPQARHGHLVEFGTDPHQNGGQFGGTQHPGTDAQPFLLPAARLTEDRTRRRIGRAVAQATRADLAGVEAYASAVGICRQIEEQRVMAGGIIDKVSFGIWNRAAQTARQLAAEYGLTPTSRARIGSAPDAPEDDDPLAV